MRAHSFVSRQGLMGFQSFRKPVKVLRAVVCSNRVARVEDPVHKHVSQVCSNLRRYLDKGQVARAVTVADECSSKYPNNAYVLMHAAMAYHKGRQIQEARNLFMRASELAPNHPKYLQAWALFEGRTGNIRRSRELFQRALDLDTGNVRVLQAWADVEARTGDAAKARQLFRRALGCDSSPSGQSFVYTAWAAMEARRGEEEGGRGSEAPAELYRKATVAGPQNGAAWVAWARYEWSRGDVNKSREVFQSGLTSLGKDNIVLLGAWAGLEAKAGNVPRARSLYRRASDAESDNLSNLLKWGQLEARSGNSDTARKIFAQGLDKDPNSLHLMHAMAQLEVHSGDRQVAKGLLRRILDTGDKDGVVLHTLGTILLEEGAIDEARRCFMEGARGSRDPRAKAQHYESWAELESYQGQRELARRVYEEGLKVVSPPSRARFLRMFALLEKRTGRMDRALSLLSDACAADPMDGRSWVHLALVQRRLGLMEEARESMERAIRVTPSNPDLYVTLASLELQNGDVAAARRVFERGESRCRPASSANLLTDFALFEAREGNYDKAREIFRRGSQLIHPPLFAAWADLEGRLGNEEDRAWLEAKYLDLLKRTAKKTRGSGPQGADQEVDAA